MDSQKRVLTGIRPSGNVHLGNFLGMIQPALSWQRQHECFFFMADLHALTTMKEPQKLLPYTLDAVATWVALGLDTTKHVLYRQSDIPEVMELTWYLSCVTGVGLLQKAHAYKDAAANSKEASLGVFYYPALMAADIILYDAHIIPVGKDQKQHVEIARDMAGSFNAVYGDILTLPQPAIEESVMTVPGLDGRRMSKSYNNEIPLFCSAKQLRKRVMSIQTDSSDMASPKSLKDTILGDYFPFSALQMKSKILRLACKKEVSVGAMSKKSFTRLLNERLDQKESFIMT
jgi:tryptophanyl-tRNA synthetase